MEGVSGWDRIRVFLLAIVAVVSVAAVALTVVAVAPDIEAPPQFFSDFDINVWEPGQAILDGESPLRALDAGPENGSVYPPAAQVATLPFALLPYDISLVLWLALLGAAVVLALRVCGVGDWRVIVVALCSPPVLYGLAYANVSLLVTLALALAWAWRDRHRRVAIVVGVVVATRLFLWPLLVWLLITGRRRAAFEGVLTAFVVSAIGWAAVEFRRIGDFMNVVRDNASEYVDDGVSVAALAANLGLSADAATLVATCAGLGRSWSHGRAATTISGRSRGRGCGGVRIAGGLGPLLALFLVPLALSTPKLSRWWLLPYLTIPQLSVASESGGRILDAASGVVFSVITCLRCRRTSSAPHPRSEAPQYGPSQAAGSSGG